MVELEQTLPYKGLGQRHLQPLRGSCSFVVVVEQRCTADSSEIEEASCSSSTRSLSEAWERYWFAEGMIEPTRPLFGGDIDLRMPIKAVRCRARWKVCRRKPSRPRLASTGSQFVNAKEKKVSPR